MKIDCISDLHGDEPELEGGDLLVIAGDLCASDMPHQYERFNDWVYDLYSRYNEIVMIAGNHDGLIEKGTVKLFECVYLQDQSFEYKGLKIWGSPWTPTFCNWFFMKNRGPHIREVWDKIPDDTDILITHGPPLGILDTVKENTGYLRKCGCDDLYETLYRLKKLKLHVFGHIHSGYGHITKDHDFPGVQFVNASLMNEDYDMVNKPIRVDL